MAIRGAKKKEDRPLYRTVCWWFDFPDGALALIMEKMMPWLAKLWNLALAEYLALDEKIRGRLEREVNPLIKEAREDDEQNDHGDLWQRKNNKVTDTQWLERGKSKDRLVRRKKLKNLLSSVYTQEVFKYFGYDKLEVEAKERAKQVGYVNLWDEAHAKKKERELLDEGFPEEMVKEFVQCRSRRYDKELMLKHQFGWLTDLREKDECYDVIRRTCEEETLKTIHGAWLSWIMLRSAGDKDAERPGQREEVGFFHAIPNRTAFNKEPKNHKSRKGGFKHDLKKDGILEVALGNFCDHLVLPIPNWDKVKKDGSRFYHRQMLEMACNFRQITISRRTLERNGKREPDLLKPGRFKVSLSFDIPKPAPVPKTPDNTVYLAFGASAIGVVSAKGEEVIHLSVPEKTVRGPDEFLPRALAKRIEITAKAQETLLGDQLQGELHRLKKRRQAKESKQGLKGIDALDSKISRCVPGSKNYQELLALRARIFSKTANRGKDNVHKVICHRRPRSLKKALHTLLWHGVHFVITDLVIRSKPRKLADASKPERRGVLGANFFAQNAGRIAVRIAKLADRVALEGGSLARKKPPSLTAEEREQTRISSALSMREQKKRRDQRKIFLARRLKEEYLVE